MTRIQKFVTYAALGLATSAALPSFVHAADKGETDYRNVEASALPSGVKSGIANATKGGKELTYQKQTTDGKSVYSVHYTDANGKRMAAHLDESGKVVKGPFAYDDSADRAAQTAAAKNSGKTQGGSQLSEGYVKYQKVTDKDMPAPVATALAAQTKGGKNVEYLSQMRGGQQLYSAHWTAADGKRMFVRLDAAGKVVLGPGETDEEDGKKISPNSNEPWTRAQVASANDLPAEVRRGIESATPGGTNHNFVKETRGTETRYYVEYDINGRRTSALFNPQGKLLEGESVAASAAASAAPAPQPAVQPATPAAAPAPEAQPAAAQIGAAAAATGPWQLIAAADQLPAEVRTAANAQLTGSTDQIIQRFTQGGQTLYGIHYTPAAGQRQFMAVDAKGQVTVEPRKSAWQPGGKKIQFQAIGADQLSPQARTTVEGLKGTDHLFVQRVGENGKKEFLVQYSAADGERTEVKLGEDGKLDEKPSKAKDNPFAAAGGKQKKN